MAESAATPELTRIISARLVVIWEAYKNHDVASHNALLAEDYAAIHPDGTRHEGKPTAEQMAAEPIHNYTLAELRLARVDDRTALLTYTAEVAVPGDLLVRFLAGEVWVVRKDEWVCRYFQATLTS